MKTFTLIASAITLVLASLTVEARGFHGPRIGIGLGFGYYSPYGWYDPWYDPWLYPYPYWYGPSVRRAPAKQDETAATNLFVYPSEGQSATQTAQDRKECNEWAVQQSGLDPATAKRRAKIQHLDEYNRAFIACMEGRKYSVK
jgi:hypothetical protein